jgi:cell fate regulator YaaT (PSP1 superfamily)
MKVREHGLAMKVTRVERAFDGSRLLFYFTADGRVDFRDLIKELAAEFRTRIELRQIGVRDEAKMLGGYGTCGRPLCCTTFLTSFEPVSIKMAKQQI